MIGKRGTIYQYFNLAKRRNQFVCIVQYFRNLLSTSKKLQYVALFLFHPPLSSATCCTFSSEGALFHPQKCIRNLNYCSQQMPYFLQIILLCCHGSIAFRYALYHYTKLFDNKLLVRFEFRVYEFAIVFK